MKLLVLREWEGHQPNTLIESNGMSIAQRRRLLTLGFLALPTVARMREAAQARGIAGWHNMKRETLIERLNNG